MCLGQCRIEKHSHTSCLAHSPASYHIAAQLSLVTQVNLKIQINNQRHMNGAGTDVHAKLLLHIVDITCD